MAKGAKDLIDAFTYNTGQPRNFDRKMDSLSAMIAYWTRCLKSGILICTYRYNIEVPDMNAPYSPLDCRKGSSRHYLAPMRTMTAC